MQGGHGADAGVGVAALPPLFRLRPPPAGVGAADAAAHRVGVIIVGDAARRHPVGHRFHRAAGVGIPVSGQAAYHPQIEGGGLAETEFFGHIARHPHINIAADAVNDQRPGGAAVLGLLLVQDVGQAQQGQKGGGGAVAQAQAEGRIEYAERDGAAQGQGGFHNGGAVQPMIGVGAAQIQAGGGHN